MTASRQANKGNGANLAILGGGNLGQALVRGWIASGTRRPEEIALTRRRTDLLGEFHELGVRVQKDNVEAIRSAEIVVLADPARHLVISVVSNVPIEEIRRHTGGQVPVVRAMPNTAISIRESMTCIAADPGSNAALESARELFNAVGTTVVIQEELMVSATALCACGVAFFLRAIRAASQGGIEIGFHPEEALALAAQTARGAASLLLAAGSHPESEIDRVTTPRGCTIAGLNEMEHQGFSSAMIKAILISAEKAGGLYRPVDPD